MPVVKEKTKDGKGSCRVKKEVKEFFPEGFDGVEEIIARFRGRESLIVCLERLPGLAAQRSLDFICGAVYAIGGSVRKVSDEKYLLIPGGVKITRLKR